MAIETSGPVGSVAAALDGELAEEESFERGMRHGRELVPRLADMCRRLGRPPETINVVAVSAGPGSYTGVRIGVTCAKTLALAIRWRATPPPEAEGKDTGEAIEGATEAPHAALVAVRTLEVLAQNADPDAEHVAVVGDARRGKVYAAFFDRIEEELVRHGDDLVLDPDELPKWLKPGTLIVGDALSRCPEALHAAANVLSDVRLGDPATATAHARHVARIGWREFRAGRTVPPHDLTPIYLRRPEAVDRLDSRRRGRSP